MPKSIKNAKIALLDVALEIEKTETDAKIEITSPDQMQAFLQQEEKMLKEMVDKITKSKANVVFVQKGIDDVAQHYLSKAGIIGDKEGKEERHGEARKGNRSKIVTSLDDLTRKGSRIRRTGRGEKDIWRADGLRREVQGPEERNDIHKRRHKAGHRRGREGTNRRDRCTSSAVEDRQVRDWRRQQ